MYILLILGCAYGELSRLKKEKDIPRSNIQYSIAVKYYTIMESFVVLT